jgi:hypothetical protein
MDEGCGDYQLTNGLMVDAAFVLISQMGAEVAIWHPRYGLMNITDEGEGYSNRDLENWLRSC